MDSPCFRWSTHCNRILPPPALLVLPAGTIITVEASEILSSDKQQPGDSFAAELHHPLVVDGWVVARPGQTVVGRIAGQKKPGVSKERRSFFSNWKGSYLSMDTRRWWKPNWWKIPAPLLMAVIWLPLRSQLASERQSARSVAQKERRSAQLSEPPQGFAGVLLTRVRRS